MIPLSHAPHTRESCRVLPYKDYQTRNQIASIREANNAAHLVQLRLPGFRVSNLLKMATAVVGTVIGSQTSPTHYSCRFNVPPHYRVEVVVKSKPTPTLTYQQVIVTHGDVPVGAFSRGDDILGIDDILAYFLVINQGLRRLIIPAVDHIAALGVFFFSLPLGTSTQIPAMSVDPPRLMYSSQVQSVFLIRSRDNLSDEGCEAIVVLTDVRSGIPPTFFDFPRLVELDLEARNRWQEA